MSTARCGAPTEPEIGRQSTSKSQRKEKATRSYRVAPASRPVGAGRSSSLTSGDGSSSYSDANGGMDRKPLPAAGNNTAPHNSSLEAARNRPVVAHRGLRNRHNSSNPAPTRVRQRQLSMSSPQTRSEPISRSRRSHPRQRDLLQNAS